MNTRIRNKKKIMALEEKVEQLEHNMSRVISLQGIQLSSEAHIYNVIKSLDHRQIDTILEFNKDIELIKKYQLEHMKEFHSSAHKSFFSKLMGGR